jgi:hypothetical protein
MAQLWPPLWLEAQEGSTADQEGAALAGFANVDAPLPFNLEGAGNSSTGTFSPNGEMPGIWLHARGKLDLAGVWTGQSAWLNIKAQYLNAYPTMPALAMSISDQATMALWGDRYVRNQGSLLDQVAQLINPDIGYTFRIVADSVANTITVSLVELNAAGVPIDLTTEAAAYQWSMRLDGMQTVDRWYVDAGRRTYLATLKVAAAADSGRMVKGWTSAQETAWDAAVNKDKQDITQVWRRWTLRHDWAGETFNSQQIPYTRTVDLSAQETGELETTGPVEDYPNGPTSWWVERTIPTGPGKDWVAGGSSAAKASPQLQRDGPLLWWVKSGEPWDPLHYDLQVTVGDKYASLMLGRDAADGATIRDRFADGWTIYATLSMVHPKSYRVSAREATEPRTDMPRTGFTFLPTGQVARIDVQPDTVIRLDDTGQPEYADDGRKDRGANLTTVREAFRKWYTTPDGGATWSRQDVDLMTPDPGTIVATLDVVIRSGTPPTEATVNLGSPVSRRVVRWDRYDPSVTWTASRIAPVLTGGGGGGAVVMAGGAAAGFKRATPDGGPRNG